jgi:hypothetical protein
MMDYSQAGASRLAAYIPVFAGILQERLDE